MKKYRKITSDIRYSSDLLNPNLNGYRDLKFKGIFEIKNNSNLSSRYFITVIPSFNFIEYLRLISAMLRRSFNLKTKFELENFSEFGP